MDNPAGTPILTISDLHDIAEAAQWLRHDPETVHLAQRLATIVSKNRDAVGPLDDPRPIPR